MLVLLVIFSIVIISNGQFYIKNAKSAPRMGRSGPPITTTMSDEDVSLQKNLHSNQLILADFCRSILAKEEMRQTFLRYFWPLLNYQSTGGATIGKSIDTNHLT